MSRLRAFLGFVYDFVVGDDPLIAVVVVLALGITAVIAGWGAAAWWVMPAAVVVVLTFSVLRASRRGPPQDERNWPGPLKR
ncbi:MAG TPA: hypothetical protein VH279_14240 [Solirubrobacteraceae bacterium]|jgi:heme A synthase|nr:hypothetical protein [Solirubrobacteraceae bacterium]